LPVCKWLEYEYKSLTIHTGENNLSFIETSALDASNVELAFQNILTGMGHEVTIYCVTLMCIRNISYCVQQSDREQRRSPARSQCWLEDRYHSHEQYGQQKKRVLLGQSQHQTATFCNDLCLLLLAGIGRYDDGVAVHVLINNHLQ